MKFEKIWEKKKAEGYQYGEDALEQVRFGWELAMESVKESVEKAAAGHEELHAKYPGSQDDVKAKTLRRFADVFLSK